MDIKVKTAVTTTFYGDVKNLYINRHNGNVSSVDCLICNLDGAHVPAAFKRRADGETEISIYTGTQTTVITIFKLVDKPAVPVSCAVGGPARAPHGHTSETVMGSGAQVNQKAEPADQCAKAFIGVKSPTPLEIHVGDGNVHKNKYGRHITKEEYLLTVKKYAGHNRDELTRLLSAFIERVTDGIAFRTLTFERSRGRLKIANLSPLTADIDGLLDVVIKNDRLNVATLCSILHFMDDFDLFALPKEEHIHG